MLTQRKKGQKSFDRTNVIYKSSSREVTPGTSPGASPTHVMSHRVDQLGVMLAMPFIAFLLVVSNGQA